MFFSSRNSEPLKFLLLFHCHQLHVFRLSGPSFVTYYASWIAAVEQNICPKGNYCSCHKRLFEAIAATGVSVIALQPWKTPGFFLLKAGSKLSADTCRSDCIQGTCVGCKTRSTTKKKKSKQKTQIPLLWTVDCFNKTLSLLQSFPQFQHFWQLCASSINETDTEATLRRHHNTHTSPSSSSESVSPFFGALYINVYQSKRSGGGRKSCFCGQRDWHL